MLVNNNSFWKDLAILYSQVNPFSNVYGAARSLLALGTLLTILFNENEVLFPISIVSKALAITLLDEINLFHLFGYDYLFISKLVACIILIVVITGFYPRITGLLHWWVTYSFFNYAIFVDGGDQITNVLVFLLIPITILDKRSNHWQNVSKNYSVYTLIFANSILLLISIQMSILYFQAGVDKIHSNEWSDGTAVYYWFNHNVYGCSQFLQKHLNPFLVYSYVVTTLTWGTIILEILLFGCIFMNNNHRQKFLTVAILFHVAIALVHGLVTFCLAMSAGLILYLRPSNKPFKLKFYNYAI